MGWDAYLHILMASYSGKKLYKVGRVKAALRDGFVPHAFIINMI